MRIESLPVGKIEHGELILGQPYKLEAQVTCHVTGKMSDGSLVWESVKTGKQYQRRRFFGKYYFIEL